MRWRFTSCIAPRTELETEPGTSAGVEEQVEEHEPVRRVAGEARHAARGRVDPLQQRVEREPARHRDHELDRKPEAHFARLESWARLHFPVTSAIEGRWSRQVMETIDGLAFIGRNPGDESVYVATGDSGMGMTHGTTAGELITDLIIGRPSCFAQLCDPARKPVRAGRDVLAEATNMAAQYRDWVTAGEVASVDRIAAGAGAVVRHGLHKLAVHRDANGTLHERSAVCPHLGGIVRWNGAHQTWDGPCHGSRFEATGRVISGPADSDLAPASR